MYLCRTECLNLEIFTLVIWSTITQWYILASSNHCIVPNALLVFNKLRTWPQQNAIMFFSLSSLHLRTEELHHSMSSQEIFLERYHIYKTFISVHCYNWPCTSLYTIVNLLLSLINDGFYHGICIKEETLCVQSLRLPSVTGIHRHITSEIWIFSHR